MLHRHTGAGTDAVPPRELAQSLLYNHNNVSFLGQIKIFWQHTKRVSD